MDYPSQRAEAQARSEPKSQAESSPSYPPSPPTAMKLGIFWLFFYAGLSLCLFFIAALTVFVLRGGQSKSFPMPELTGKNFIDIYNGLQRLDLRVAIVKREYRDLPAGFILSQSLAPGKLVAHRDKLELTVNQPRPFLAMPELRSRSLENAQELLKRIPGEEGVYAISIAAISYIETGLYPPDTVVMQFPPVGSPVSWSEQVYLLVAASPRENTEESLSGIERDRNRIAEKSAEGGGGRSAASERRISADIGGQKVSIAAEYFHQRGLDYRLRSSSLSLSWEQRGSVHALTKRAGEPYLLDIYWRQPAVRSIYGYERIVAELDGAGPCEARQHFYDADIRKRYTDSEIIFRTGNYSRNEKVEIIFYRLGPVKTTLHCGEKLVYEEEIIPDYPA